MYEVGDAVVSHSNGEAGAKHMKKACSQQALKDLTIMDIMSFLRKQNNELCSKFQPLITVILRLSN
jgi:hypothetical protein